MLSDKKVRCSMISIDCADTTFGDDSEQIITYSMDFLVRKEKREEMFKFITIALGHFGIDPISMHMLDAGLKENADIHTKNTILATIRDYSKLNAKSSSKRF